MPDETPSSDDAGQSGGLNVHGDTSIGGNAVGRDSITQTTTNTTITEGGPVARYAVIGVIVIAALAIIIIALLAFQDRYLVPTATPTASITPSLTPSPTSSVTASPTPLPPTATLTDTPTATPTPPPSPTDTPLPPTETPSPSPSPTLEGTLPPPPTETATPTPRAVPTESTSPVPTLTPWPTSALPLYDNFASSCLKKENWMLDWVWQSPLPTPGAPLCLDTRPQFMAADGGLIVFLDSAVGLTRSVAHILTSAQPGYYKQVEVAFALNKVDVFTDTRTAYLSAGISVLLARPADADLEIRLQGSNVNGKFGYQVTSLLTLKEGGNISGSKLAYLPGQPVVAAFRVRGNKLTAYVDGQPVAGPFSILSEPSAVNIGYYADPETAIDGVFAEVRILQIAASEFPETAAVSLPARLIPTVRPPPPVTPTPP